MLTEITTTTTPEAEPGDRLLWGAEAIARYVRDVIGAPDFEVREAFYQLDAGRLPGTKVGRAWVSSENTLKRFFAEKLDAALAAALAAKLEAAPTSELVAPKRTDARSSKRHGRRTGRSS